MIYNQDSKFWRKLMSTNRRKKSTHPQRGTKKWQLTDFALLLLVSLLAILTSWLLFSNHFLEGKSSAWILLMSLGLIIILATFLVWFKKLLRLTGLILFLLLIGLSLFLYVTKSTLDAAKQMNESSFYSDVQMSVVVAKDSSINKVSDVRTVEAPVDIDGSNIKSLLADVKENEKVTLTPNKVSSYQTAYQAIREDKSKAMVVNNAYIPLLEDNKNTFNDNVKTIYTFTVRKTVKKPSQPKNKDVFNIYISGIDTYGPITTVSRSDVNIIMTVNLNTKKILLTTTPRDSYVKIPDGGGNQYDKLTHAGIYGVETSEKTLENLYGIDIDYYARINFTSFMNLIDLLGGIEVVNTQSFTSHGYDFPTGKIALDSKKALIFARERYQLDGGDNDRGKNQEKVIAAIIRKMTSFKSLANFSSLLNGLSDSIQTNMTSDKLLAIANKQIADGNRFTVTSQDVTGTGSTGMLKSYAMPEANLYMYSLDEQSLSKAKSAILNVMEGQ